jgi:DNA repair photolyase
MIDLEKTFEHHACSLGREAANVRYEEESGMDDFAMQPEQELLRPLRGRGALQNPAGRFEPIEVVYDPESPELEPDAIRTQYFRDHSQSIIATNDSPDVGFNASINPYRGCEHGCIYCFARPTHEYLGMSAGLDFESKIFVKMDAPRLLRKALSARSWVPQTVIVSGVTDCYQPIERHLKLTRQCLEVMAEFRNPAGIITKNHLITRDIDVLRELAEYNCIRVFISVTTLDENLARSMEPRASAPAMRLRAIRELSAAGIPVGVMMGPVIPGLTDHEMDAIFKSAAEAGATSAGYVMLRLPHGVKDLFETWLETHFPARKDRVLNKLRGMRGGKLYESKWGTRMRGEGSYADYVSEMFELCRRRHGLDGPRPELSTGHFRTGEPTQLSLF